jgi:elongation factor Ts
MPQISADLIKKLRNKTGASLMMIKRALEETGGDEEKALEVLKRLGVDAAQKKALRETSAGKIEAYIHNGAKVGVLLEIRSETDFVSRNEEFGALAHGVAMHIAAMNPGNIDELLTQSYVMDESLTIKDLVSKSSAKFGENIELRQFVRYEL